MKISIIGGGIGGLTLGNFLKQHNIEYTSIDISEDEEALAKIRSLGIASVPVVETETETWTGFNPLKLRTLI